MANLVRLRGDTAELPYLSLRYPVAPAESSLREGLAAFRDLQQQVGLQSLPLARREEIIGFLRRFGILLHRCLFPQGQGRRLHPGLPMLLDVDPRWADLPWELLHDGRQWLALQQGVVRFHPGGSGTEAREPASSVLAVTALPVPGAPDDALGRAYREAGSRFVTQVAELPESGAQASDISWRLLEHADVAGLEHELRNTPHILLWSGMTTAKCWLMEGRHLEPELLPVAQLLDWLRPSVRRGLRLMVLNDSLGQTGSPGAAEQAATLLGSGLPALIRVDGAQARVRQQDYLRTLARHMGQGFSTFESHLSALRRLYRRFEAGWDWSYLRLHTRQIPAPPEPGDTLRRESREGGRLRTTATVRGNGPPLEPAAPTRVAPPVFRRRRRVFGRHPELRALAQAILPAQAPSSPLVFLHGGTGTGKTVLALDLARRMQRRFDQIVYLDGGELLPDAARQEAGAALQLQGLSPLDRYSAELALRLGAASQRDSASALLRLLEDGRRRLVILDGWEARPAFEEWLVWLSKASAAHTRILVTSRRPPPVLPGFREELRPVDGAALGAIFDEAFLERLHSRPDGDSLLDLCRRDLLLARVLRRRARWPDAPTLARLLSAQPGAPQAPRDPVLAWAADEALHSLGDPARRALEALVLLTGLVHQDLIAQVSGLDSRDCAEALTALQWAGLADAHDGERYASLHPRLNRVLGETVMTRAVFAPLAPRIGLAYESYLAATARAVAATHAHSAWHAPEVGFAWLGAQWPLLNSADPRDVQRLAIERVNLAEAALILLEEGDSRTLSRWCEEARPLVALRWQCGVQLLLGAYLFAVAGKSPDEVLQSRALNRVGAALLAAGDFGTAARILPRGLDLASRHGDWEALSEGYVLLAHAYRDQAQWDAAKNLLYSAVELAYQLGAGAPLVAALQALVPLWERPGPENEMSESFLLRAIGFLEERNQLHLAAQVRRLRGRLRRKAGQADLAETELRQALRAFQRAGDRREAGLTGLALAELLADQERADAGQDTFDEAAQALRDAHAADPALLAEALGRLARLYERQRRVPEALRAWREVRDWRERAGDRDGVIQVLDVLGSLYFRLGEQEQSTRCYEERMMLQAGAAALG